MINKNIFITKNAKQTQKLGEMLSEELRGRPARNASQAIALSRSDVGGEIVCLTGELGSGKTTFAQGMLKGLSVKGPHTSPTFVVLKQYKVKSQKSKVKDSSKNLKVKNIYHVDVYRVGPKDILDLGWEEITANKNNLIIVEWAEKIKRIIPKRAVWIMFNHKGKNEREIKIQKCLI